MRQRPTASAQSDPLTNCSDGTLAPAVAAAGSPAAWRPRFSLRELLAVVTWLGAVMALAVGRFSGWTMPAIGFSVAALNCTGKLARLQSPPVRGRVRRWAWLLLLISMFLPAMRGCGNAPITGWQVATVTFAWQIDLLRNRPAGEAAIKWASDYALITLLNVGNILAALFPLVAVAVARRGRRCFVLLFACCTSAMCCGSIANQPGTWLIGYYVWCGAMICLLTTVRLRRRELVAMICLTLLRWATLGWLPG
jgi:hypothetical protein